MRYLINGIEFNHVGHDGRKQVYFFVQANEKHNHITEIPFSFDGQISIKDPKHA